MSDTETLQRRQVELLEELVKRSGATATHTKTTADSALRQRRLYSLAGIWVFVGVVYLANGALAGYNRAAESWWGRRLGLGELSNPVQDFSPDNTPLEKGDTVGSWTVSSGKGPRVSPGGVGSTDHKGVDLVNKSGPTLGAPIYAPFDTRVGCTLTGGGGIEAVVKNESLKLRLLHLSQCLPGPAKSGSIIAYVGNTGSATTGPHLHVEQYDPGLTTPAKKWAAALLGVKLGFSVEAYKAAIATQESGGSYSSVNKDSGALGKYQFMPGTMKSTAKRCIGAEPTETQFLADPALQDKIMDCYAGSALKTIQKKTENPLTQCRMMAAYHYSGDLNLWDDHRPQATNGNKYPSIADYTRSVCKGAKSK